MVVSWFSCGVSSAVATKIALSKYPNMRVMYTHIDDQHKDTLRFLHDCEKWFGVPVELLQGQYRTVEAACRAASYLVGVAGAACTRLLKRRPRQDWELENPGRHTYVWGIDAGEKHRVERILKYNIDHNHVFPLIEHNLLKSDVHGMLQEVGINRPAMYDLGYPNNNCVGCLKAKSMGYWNKIRQDFPEVFKSRCALEKVIGGRVFNDFWLEDLKEGSGRDLEMIAPECGIFCEIPTELKGVPHD